MTEPIDPRVPINPGPPQGYYPPAQPVDDTMNKAAKGTIGVILTLFLIFCGIPGALCVIMLLIGGIGSLFDSSSP
jgi:hypothetical protein